MFIIDTTLTFYGPYGTSPTLFRKLGVTWLLKPPNGSSAITSSQVFQTHPSLAIFTTFQYYCSSKMSKRMFPNDSKAPCNNSPPPPKKQRICIVEQKETERNVFTLQFTSGNNEYNEQQMIKICDALKLNELKQRKDVAALLYYALSTTGISSERIFECIELLFYKVWNQKVVVIDTQKATSNSATHDLESIDDQSDASYDLRQTPSQTPESQRLTQDSLNNDFLDVEEDENAHMVNEDEECDEANISISATQSSGTNSSQNSQTSSVSDVKSQASSVCF